MTNPMMALFLGVSTLATSAFAQDPQVPQAKYILRSWLTTR